ncbi:hypothetical protein [Streptomyces roseoverticillatus]|uniref:Fumarylacetoacetase-like C-terminal domain-containing protein n=1 Tax=Streptomyces roseoverticillatus TaxID=66429 RepID=A0ABV3J4N1_9ACTN
MPVKVTGSYELALGYADSKLTWDQYLDGYGSQVRPRAGRPVPFLPEEPSRAAVYSFGYTHRAVNGAAVEKGRLDFYYKGTGGLLCTDGERLANAVSLTGGGIEAEFCAVYCMNKTGEPVYLGYTLANDFSDAGLRHARRNLANLSKLQPTAVASEVVLADLPESSAVNASISRAGRVVWQRDGALGRREMLYAPRVLERLLLHRPGLFAAGTVVYLLLGSCISSHKDGAELRDGDVVTLQEEYSGLRLSTPVSVSC